MPTFDIDGARAQGYSDEAIKKHLLGLPGTAEARKAGHTDSDILEYFKFKPKATPGAESGEAEGGLDRAARLAKMAGSRAVKGVATGIGAIGDVENALTDVANKYVPESIKSAVNAIPRGLRLGNVPTTEETVGLTNKLGLTGRPELEPRSQGERYLAAGAEGLGSAVPFMALPGSAVVAGAAGATGGMSGEAAHQLYPESELAPIIGGVLGGGGVQIAHSAISSSKILKAARSLGSSGTMQEAGEFAQDAARQWLKVELPTKLNNVWSPVGTVMAGKPTDLVHFDAALAGMSSKAGSLQPVADALKSNLPERLRDILQNRTSVGVGVAPSWEDVKELRTVLGDAMKNPQVIKDIPAERLATLYKSLTDDMKASARAVGPHAEQLFNAANKESKRLYDFAEGPVKKIVASASRSADDPLPEKAATVLLRGGKTGASDLAALRAELPHVADELAAAHLRAPKLEWTKLSPEAKTALIEDQALRHAVNKAASAAAMPATDQGTNLVAALLGEETAKNLSEYMNTHHNDLLDPHAAAVAGAIAPSIYRGLRGVATNPLSLKAPAIGGFAGKVSSE